MKAYVINMDKDIDKMNFMVSQQSKIPADLIRVSAVDGRRLTPQQIAQHTSRPCAEFCTKSIIGCYLSHVKVWSEIVKNDDMAIVLEDDAEISDDFQIELARIFKEFADSNKEFQFINLGVGVIDAIDVFADKSQYQTVYEPIFPFYSHCYLVTSAGAAELLKHAKAEWHVDVVMARILKDAGIPMYASKKCLATQSTKFDSSQSAGFPIVLSKLLNFDIVGTLNIHKLLATPVGAIKGVTIDVYLVLFTLLLLLFPVIHVVMGIVSIWLLDIILFRKVNSRIGVYLLVALVINIIKLYSNGRKNYT